MLQERLDPPGVLLSFLIKKSVHFSVFFIIVITVQLSICMTSVNTVAYIDDRNRNVTEIAAKRLNCNSSSTTLLLSGYDDKAGSRAARF